MSLLTNKLSNRQNVMALVITITLADFLANDNAIAIPLPLAAQVVGGDAVIVTPFDTTGTDTLNAGDSVDADEYLAATNLKAAAGTRVALTLTGYQTDADTKQLLLARTPADANATEGAFRLTVLYVEEGKGGFIQD